MSSPPVKQLSQSLGQRRQRIENTIGPYVTLEIRTAKLAGPHEDASQSGTLRAADISDHIVTDHYGLAGTGAEHPERRIEERLGGFASARIFESPT